MSMDVSLTFCKVIKMLSTKLTIIRLQEGPFEVIQFAAQTLAGTHNKWHRDPGIR